MVDRFSVFNYYTVLSKYRRNYEKGKGEGVEVFFFVFISYTSIKLNAS